MATNTDPVGDHREELQNAMSPLVDAILDAAFFEKIISCDAYARVLRCGSVNRPHCLFLVVQRCVTKSQTHYDKFVNLLKKLLPPDQSKKLLGKSRETLKGALFSLGKLRSGNGMHKCFSEPTVSQGASRHHFKTSFGANDSARDRENEETSLDDDGDGGGLMFTCGPETNGELVSTEQGVASPVEERGDGDRARSKSELAVRRKDQAVTATRRRNRDKQYTATNVDVPTTESEHTPPDSENRAVREVLHHNRNLKLECQQRQAQIVTLSEEVKKLNDRLSSAVKQNEKLSLKKQRHNEEIENLHDKMSNKISALRERLQAGERYKTQIAELEAEQHTV